MIFNSCKIRRDSRFACEAMKFYQRREERVDERIKVSIFLIWRTEMSKVTKRLTTCLTSILFTGVASAFPIASVGTEGYAIVSNGGDIVATYLGNSASYSDDLLLGSTLIFNNQSTPVGTKFDLGTFTAGTELIFSLRVNNTGNTFFSGSATRNTDGVAHARVQSNYGSANATLVSFEDLYGDPEGIAGFNDLSFSFTNTIGSATPPVTAAIPEPATWVLIGAGLLGLAFRRRRCPT